MPAYNSTEFDPPAPLATVTLQHHDTEAKWTGVPMLLDTGADVTLIPQEVVDRLNLVVHSDNGYELAGFDGTTSVAFAVELKLLFCNRSFRGKFLLADQSVGIIGRDILNFIPLNFDGPKLEWSEPLK